MGTISDIMPNEGDIIAGSDGRGRQVVVVAGELFWNGQVLSAYRGDCFSVVSRSGKTASSDDLEAMKAEKAKAATLRALDKKYM